MFTINDINQMTEEELTTNLSQCCGSRTWLARLIQLRPYRDLIDLIEKSNQVWYSLEVKDWKEAFADHPKIGDIESLREKYSQHHKWSEEEQEGIEIATASVINHLADANRQYEDKFGYIYIIFATGKSAKEMLDILYRRLENSPADEINIASREQNKITRDRLSKLVQITTDLQQE